MTIEVGKSSGGGIAPPLTANIGQGSDLSTLPTAQGLLYLELSTSSSSSNGSDKTIEGKIGTTSVWLLAGTDIVPSATLWTNFLYHDGDNSLYFILSSGTTYTLARVTASNGAHVVLGSFVETGNLGISGYVERETLTSGNFTWYAGNKVLVISSIDGSLVSSTPAVLDGMAATATNKISGFVAPDGRGYALARGAILDVSLYIIVSTRLGTDSDIDFVLRDSHVNPVSNAKPYLINWMGYVMLVTNLGTKGVAADRCWNRDDFWRWMDERIGEIV